MMVELTAPLDSDRYYSLVQEEILPKFLKIIEESGISCQDAARLPSELEIAINWHNQRTLEENSFKIQRDPLEQLSAKRSQ